MINPQDVAGYYLSRATADGDLITNLKMQKLVYYAYAWHLVINGEKLFDAAIEAWPRGPVVPSLYRQLSVYGAGPLPADCLLAVDAGTSEEEGLGIPIGTLSVLDQVYEQYGSLSAFELVTLTHDEKPWKHAREGYAPTDSSNVAILDSDIRDEYGPRLKDG